MLAGWQRRRHAHRHRQPRRARPRSRSTAAPATTRCAAATAPTPSSAAPATTSSTATRAPTARPARSAATTRFQLGPGRRQRHRRGRGPAPTVRLQRQPPSASRSTFSANGGRVRLTRNIANITMDLDDVEAAVVRTLGRHGHARPSTTSRAPTCARSTPTSATRSAAPTAQPDTVVAQRHRRGRTSSSVSGDRLAGRSRRASSPRRGSRAAEPGARPVLRINTLAGNDSFTHRGRGVDPDLHRRRPRRGLLARFMCPSRKPGLRGGRRVSSGGRSPRHAAPLAVALAQDAQRRAALAGDDVAAGPDRLVRRSTPLVAEARVVRRAGVEADRRLPVGHLQPVAVALRVPVVEREPAAVAAATLTVTVRRRARPSPDL